MTATGPFFSDWVHEMAVFVKQLDVNHMVALGDEGFFNEHHFLEHNKKGQLYDGRHGTDFAAILIFLKSISAAITFIRKTGIMTTDLEFGDQWITDHANIANGR